MIYQVVQHWWGFEVRNVALGSTVVTYRRELHKSFSECRTLAQEMCDAMNRGRA